jgi:hypothetical protein
MAITRLLFTGREIFDHPFDRFAIINEFVNRSSICPLSTRFIKNAPENREVFSLADEWRGFRYDK